MAENERKYSRREILRAGGRGAGFLGVGGAAGFFAQRAAGEDTVWQIDPQKCIACELCSSECVLEPSAVKVVHNFEFCGYCKLCFAYYNTDMPQPTGAGAEKQICPTHAVVRKHVQEDAYQYTIDEELCTGCGRCVKECMNNANGSLFMQVRHDRCVNCNECTISLACPVDAFRRVPADKPYIIKTQHGGSSA